MGFFLALAGLFLAGPGSAFAAGSKINPLLENARKASKPALRALSRTQAVSEDTASAKVMVRIKKGTTKAELAAIDPKVKIGVVTDGVATAEIPFASLDAFAADPRVENIYLSLKYKPKNDMARSGTKNGSDFLGVLSTYSVAGLGSYDGTGVIVGIVDTGIDWRHQDFITGTGTSATSRLLFYWDQTASGSVPGYSTGGLDYANAELTTNVRSAACLADINQCTIQVQDQDGHGTHVTGTAAGDGSAPDGTGFSGLYRGMAPAADIIGVQTDFSDNGICEGVEYVFAKAAALGKPAVVNLSLGGHLGAHDGSTDFETCITDLMLSGAAAGKVVAVAAGNEGADPIYATRTGSGDITMDRPNFGTEYVDFWIDSGDAFTIAVTATDQSCGTLTQTAGTWVVPTSANFCNAKVSIYNLNSHASNPTGGGASNAKEILVIINDTATDPLNWKFTFTRTSSGGSGRVDGWVAVDSQFTAPTVSYTHTVGMPGTAPNVITVGAYTTKTTFGGTLGQFAYFTSIGPNRINTVKPDISAPGQAIVSAFATLSTHGNQTTDGKHGYMQGTSMATPVTTGAIALLLQQNPTLTSNQVKALLEARARSDTKAASLPNNTYGYGKLMATPAVTVAPTGLAGSGNAPGTVRWTWSDLGNEEGYRIKTTTGGLLGSVGTSVVQFDETGLQPNTQYSALVEAFNLAGSTSGLTASAYSGAAIPPAVTVLSAASTTVSIRYFLGSNPVNTALEVSMSTDSFAANFSTPVAFTAISTDTTLGLTGLFPGWPYTFRVRARNTAGVATAFSATATTSTITQDSPPAVAVTAAVQGVSSITWSWGLAAGATSYSLFQSTDGATLGSTTLTTFTRTGLAINTRYGLRVSGTNSFGSAPLSTPSEVYTKALAPAAPAPGTVGVSSLSFTWSAAGDPAGTVFTAELSTNSFATLLASSRTVAVSAVFSALSPNTSHYLRVRAENGDGIATTDTSLSATPTLAAVPSAFSMTGLSSSSLYAFWDDSGNPSDTEYELSLSSDGFATSISTPMPFTADLSMEVTGLLSATTYYGRVRARSRAGVNTVFASSQTTTQTGAPPAPGTAFNGLKLFPNPVPHGPAPYLAIIGTPAATPVDCFNPSGVRVSSFTTNNSGIYIWFMTDGGGNALPDEVYYCTLTDTANHLSTTAFVLNGVGGAGQTVRRLLAGAPLGTYSFQALDEVAQPLGAVTLVNGAFDVASGAPATISATAPSGPLLLQVPAGAFGTTVTFNFTTPSTLPAAASADSPLIATGNGIEIDAGGGAQPGKTLTLTMTYTLPLPSGLTTDKLVISRYDPSIAAWRPLPSTVDTTAHTVTARLDHLSLYQVMGYAAAAGLAQSAPRVYPNPAYSSRGQSMTFELPGLGAGIDVKVYTFRGDLVRSLVTNSQGKAIWDCRNSGGSSVASGVYLTLIKSGGDTKTVRVMVER